MYVNLVDNMNPSFLFFSQWAEALQVGKSSFYCDNSACVMYLLNFFTKYRYLCGFRKQDSSYYNNGHKHRRSFRATLRRSRLEVFLPYDSVEKRPLLTSIFIFSKPTRAVYVRVDEVVNYCTPRSLVLISTSQGLLSGTEAIRRRLGGTLLVRIQ